jgi:hypothetical protein
MRQRRKKSFLLESQCMVEFWMGTYDCCRAPLTAIRSAEASREISHQRIKDQDFEMSNSIENENPEIAICDFTT